MLYKQQILLIVNPISGGTDKTELVATINEKVTEKGQDLTVYATICGDNEQEIKQLISELKPVRVLVAGGDGTIQLVAGILQHTSIPMGIFPAGSANGFAVSLDIPDDIHEQAEIALGSNLVDIDLLDLNGHLCIHIADLGVNAELIKNYANGNIRGKLGYILHSIPSYFRADFPYMFKIEANGKIYEEEGILLAIANANKFGTGAIINPAGKIDDGKFELILFKNFDLSSIFKTLGGQLTPDMEFVEIISTDEAHITCGGKVPFQVDGEYIGDEQTVVVKLSPNKLKLAMPVTI